MDYIILSLGVLSLLALAGWHYASKRVKVAEQGMDPSALAVQAAGSLTARLLKGERKDDKPCLTPIDCVARNRCAGHCGCR